MIRKKVGFIYKKIEYEWYENIGYYPSFSAYTYILIDNPAMPPTGHNSAEWWVM